MKVYLVYVTLRGEMVNFDKCFSTLELAKEYVGYQSSLWYNSDLDYNILEVTVDG